MYISVEAIKQASERVGASYVYYACYYIEECHKTNDINGILRYYPLLVEAIVEFKRFSRKTLSNTEGKFLIRSKF